MNKHDGYGKLQERGMILEKWQGYNKWILSLTCGVSDTQNNADDTYVIDTMNWNRTNIDGIVNDEKNYGHCTDSFYVWNRYIVDVIVDMTLTMDTTDEDTI